MGDESKNAVDGQGDSVDGAAVSPSPAHDAAAAPSPPADSASDQPAESSPQADGPEGADKKSTADDTVATANDDQDEPKSGGEGGGKPVAYVASNKKARPPYKYDPNKITLRFLFANKDGLTVTVECKPGDTVGEVKGALLSVWPDDLPDCAGGESLRLICMGKGFLMPDTRTLEDCQIPVFKTHPTPINVSIKPSANSAAKADPAAKSGGASSNDPAASAGANAGTQQASQGCACTIL